MLNAKAKLESGMGVAIRRKQHNRIFPVAMRVGVTPVPIPNTKVKTDAADNTWLETTWEDRWLPDFKKVLSEIRYKKDFLYGLADKAGAEIDRAYCIQPRSKASWSRQDAYRIKKDIFI